MSSRPKGYAPWVPKPHVEQIMVDVEGVFETYRANLPLTVRQVFYRLVATTGYPKDERAYKRLAEYLVKARRSRRIPFSWIRDDGVESGGGGGYDEPDQFWQSVRYSADAFKRDRQEGQERRVEVWCEAAGMVPQLARVARPYSVGVLSSGGFSSLTAVRDIVDRVTDRDQATVLLHVGDFDPSGESIFESMAEDVERFVRAETGEERFFGHRVALTADQVEEHNLPTAPPKASDTRSRSWVGETCQLEAMPPSLLASTVQAAIEEHLDLGIWQDVVDEEKTQREDLVATVDELLEGRGQR